MVFGLAASSLLLFKKEGLLESLQAGRVDKLKPAFRSTDGSLDGMDAFLGVVCYNTVEGPEGRRDGAEVLQGPARAKI